MIPPGSQDRRIPREYLIKFLKEHGMPLGDLEDEAMAKVLIVDQDQILIENLRRELPVELNSRSAACNSIFLGRNYFSPAESRPTEQAFARHSSRITVTSHESCIHFRPRCGIFVSQFGVHTGR